MSTKTASKKINLTEIKKRLAEVNFDNITLDRGAHSSPDKGMCVMEAVAFLANEKFSDHPACACPVISAFLRRWNDRMNCEERQQLKRYILPLVGSKSTRAVEIKRAWMATDWAIRTGTPIALRAAKLNDHAKALEQLDEITDVDSLRRARPVLDAALEAAREARRKAWSGYWVAEVAEVVAEVAEVAAEAAEVAVAAAEAEAAEVAEVAAEAAEVAVAEAAEVAAAEVAAAEAEKIRADLTVSAHDLVSRMLAVKE